MPKKVGIIGTGFMGLEHLKVWHSFPDAVVAAVCSPSGRGLDGDFSHVQGNIGSGAEATIDVSQMLRVTDPLELIESDVDIVDICAPTEFHGPLIKAALDAGKHVLCEKPLARTVAEALAIQEVVAACLASDPNCRIMPAFCIRFWPAYALLAEMCRDGRYGRLRSAKLIREAPMPTWAAHFAHGATSGGALYDLLTHDLDFARLLGGGSPLVKATGEIGQSGAVDNVDAWLTFGDDVKINVKGGWNAPEFRMHFEAVFDTAAVILTGTGVEVDTGGSREVVTVSGLSGWNRMIRHFLDCVNTPALPLRATIDDAVDAVRLCDEIERQVTGPRG